MSDATGNTRLKTALMMSVRRSPRCHAKALYPMDQLETHKVKEGVMNSDSKNILLKDT